MYIGWYDVNVAKTMGLRLMNVSVIHIRYIQEVLDNCNLQKQTRYNVLCIKKL